jgi:hypothetical protein
VAERAAFFFFWLAERAAGVRRKREREREGGRVKNEGFCDFGRKVFN